MHMVTCGVGCSFQQGPSDVLHPNDNTKVSLPWNNVLGQGKDQVLLVWSLSLFYPIGSEAERRSILMIDCCKNASFR